MASIIKISVFALFLGLMSKGTLHQCTFDDLKFTQVATGIKVRNKPEWNVTVNNECICTQFNIQVLCYGFQTVEKIDPSILTIGNDTCLLLEDDRIYGFHNFSFTYAWDAQFPFKAVSSFIACS